MTILEIIIAAGTSGVRLGELANMMSAPKSTVHGLVRGLLAMGYVREQENRYFAGPTVSTLLGEGGLTTGIYHEALSNLSGPPCNETAMIGALAGDDVIYLDAVEAKRDIRYSAPLHLRRPLWPSSVGKAILAFTAASRRDAILAQLQLSDQEVRDAKDELARVRDERVSVNVRVTGEVTGIASPIINSDGYATRAVAIGGPTERVLANVESLSDAVRTTAALLSHPDTAAAAVH